MLLLVCVVCRQKGHNDFLFGHASSLILLEQATQCVRELPAPSIKEVGGGGGSHCMLLIFRADGRVKKNIALPYL